MLQDLDALTQRMRQVARLVRDLRAERGAFQERIHELEQECQALKARQAREHEEFTRMSERLAHHDRELQSAQEESARAHALLEGQIHDHQAHVESLQKRLSQVESDRDCLRDAASGAQQQIELILERLPGAEA